MYAASVDPFELYVAVTRPDTYTPALHRSCFITNRVEADAGPRASYERRPRGVQRHRGGVRSQSSGGVTHLMPGTHRKGRRRVIASALPFTRFDDGRIAIFVWRAAISDRLQSSQFFHDALVTVDESEDDVVPVRELVAERLVQCTDGAFGDAPQLMRRMQHGLLCLHCVSGDYDIHCIPVRSTPAAVTTSAGEGRWVLLDDLVARCRSQSPDCVIDNDTSIYLLLMTTLRDNLERLLAHFTALGLTVPEHSAGVADSHGIAELPAPSAEARSDSSGFYACRKCSRPIFGSSSVVDHPPSSSQSCGSIFIDDGIDVFPLGEVSGKLSCPHCHSRLGSYDWSGSQCSCGAWVAPSIQVPKSRLDWKPPRPILTRR